MRILVLVKHLPNHMGVRRFGEDHLVDREAANGILGELDEYSLEQASRIGLKTPATITTLCMGSPAAEKALQKTLQLGADEAVLLSDPRLRGSDAVTTSLVLAAAVRVLEEAAGVFDLILLGMSSTDSYMGTMAAMLAERLSRPQLTFATELEIDVEGKTATITRNFDERVDVLSGDWPTVVSITDQTPAGRTPTIKDIAAARRKRLIRLAFDDLGLSAADVGPERARALITTTAPLPGRPVGVIVDDDGSGSAARQLAEFLLANSGR